MKLGTENRKQLITLAVLGGLAVLLLGYEFWPVSSTTMVATTTSSSGAISTTTGSKHAMRRTASGKLVPVGEARLDPTLDLNLLGQSEQIKYEGNGRNIFVEGSVAKIPTPIRNGTAKGETVATAIAAPPLPPPPPPITLKFFGFANKPGETKKVFLSQGEDIFIAAEGDIVDRRYRVLRISPNAVDVEDVINNNRQSLPLTQG